VNKSFWDLPKSGNPLVEFAATRAACNSLRKIGKRIGHTSILL
jgi:hypothetical protein